MNQYDDPVFFMHMRKCPGASKGWMEPANGISSNRCSRICMVKSFWIWAAVMAGTVNSPLRMEPKLCLASAKVRR